MKLTHFESRLLWILTSKPRGETIPRTEIMAQLYPEVEEKYPKSNSLEVLIARMRRKGYPNIKAVRGVGYMMEEPERSYNYNGDLI